MAVTLKYKKQRFQTEAAQAVVDVFRGQPKGGAQDYIMDRGISPDRQTQIQGRGYTIHGMSNSKILLDNETLKKNIIEVQGRQDLKREVNIEKLLRLTVEMETGTGKTYTYIKTMFELNKAYGWTKFIIVVPSIAIREGVKKSFETMREHFNFEYETPMSFFVYNSKQLDKIDAFSKDTNIHVMIINTQAFNSSFDEDKNREGRGGDAAARIIYTRRDDFGSRRPIDVLAANNPIMIIDEPQTVLGVNKQNQTRKGLKQFNPLFMIQYSATHREQDKVNMVYRLDAMDALNMKLVKKIEVNGIEQVGNNATSGFLYLDGIIITKGNPQARISFDIKTQKSLKRTTKAVSQGFNIYVESGQLEEYANNFIVDEIDGRDGFIRLRNNDRLYIGDVIGAANEDDIRRIQIHQTIEAHIQKEKQLYPLGIKVLSLFFIDHVDNYWHGGKFAKMFEEEYKNVVNEKREIFDDEAYTKYLLKSLDDVSSVHAGYFSRDKKGNAIDSHVSRNSTESDDSEAYDLIMRDKERLLSLEEPVRFIFSHSALKEGWDNPNVFQICTLKDSDNSMRKRQEIGRGMRLCVNQNGDRQDTDVWGKDVFAINTLTVVASQSYDSFASALQTEYADAIDARPIKVTASLFKDLKYTDANGVTHVTNEDDSLGIYDTLIKNGYVKKGSPTDKYYSDRESDSLDFGDYVEEPIAKVIDKVYNPAAFTPGNAKRLQEQHFIKKNFDKKEFQELWKRINKKTYYVVNLDTTDLVRKCIASIDNHLSVSDVSVIINTGTLESIDSKQQLEAGEAMKQGQSKTVRLSEVVSKTVKYDLIGKIVEATQLKRSDIIKILKGIRPQTFGLYQRNPEEFILKVGRLINEQKAIAVVEHIVYHKTGQTYDSDIFSAKPLKGILGVNAMESVRSLFDLIVVDSPKTEMAFANDLEKSADIAVYTKLPGGFKISTPLGNYNPDWAVTFNENSGVKHIYFVAETKGDTVDTELRGKEQIHIECARKHFAAISDGDYIFDYVHDYKDLLEKVMK